MATVFLPCESEDWPEDKKLFLILASLRSADDLGRLIAAHTRSGASAGAHAAGESALARRLRALAGLHAFLVTHYGAEERRAFFSRTLPLVARSASLLDERVPSSGLPFLKRQEGERNTRGLSWQLVSSLGVEGERGGIEKRVGCQ